MTAGDLCRSAYRCTGPSMAGSTGRTIYSGAALTRDDGRAEPAWRAARYIALNPVVARLVIRAEDWSSSAVRAHLAGEDDELATVAPLRAPPILPPYSNTGGPRDNGSDRPGTHDRTTAWSARMDRNAGAAAGPPACSRQTRPKAERVRDRAGGTNRCCQNSSKLSP
jgi:hypothetical protein